jgi:site-specific DNA-methyltransferase (adenine-specific)
MPDTSLSASLVLGDARNLQFIADESIHLVVTSPPYWNLKRYNEHPGQMGHIDDYEAFLAELNKVWAEVLRVLVPGGRLVCVVGDVCVSRKNFGRHVVFPLHADICTCCRRLGFDNLNPIIWHKISNAAYEVNNGSAGFLGKPYEPNAIIKNDIEFILMQRKPGGYRKPTEAQREASRIGKKEYQEWFQQFWQLTGASTREHPAPYPLELANRLVRMFSFTGDTVLDPFAGTGTTLLAAANAGRNSIGVELDAEARSRQPFSECPTQIPPLRNPRFRNHPRRARRHLPRHSPPEQARQLRPGKTTKEQSSRSHRLIVRL